MPFPSSSLAALGAAVFAATVHAATPAAPRMYVGYAGSWNTSIADLVPANIPNYFTHVNLAFARPDTRYVKGSHAFDQSVAGFEFVEGASTSNGQRLLTPQQAQALRSNIAALKARGTQVWLSVGGWAYSRGSEWANFDAARVVDLAQDLGASGVDIDWEAEGSRCNKLDAASFGCNTDGQIVGIIDRLHDEIGARGARLGISVAGWSTGAYYVRGTPFEEGKVQSGSPFGGVMYTVVKTRASKLSHVNLMSYDGGDTYDPREGYESYRAIFPGPINVGMEIAPEGAGDATLRIPAHGVAPDADMLTGRNNVATPYYNVETLVNYVKAKGKPNDGFMLWQIWKQRVHQPAPAGAATENSAGQFVCRNLPLKGDCRQTIPALPKLQ
ncbi:glycosyl hydrolase family 18 protein [Piscinibacter sp. XHJ-5]|uniref:glycosyl hydrolase family 18 protein n=1 Tax=Piscinibacter sp. XHJ-5 TaxID=3037797 RepID=UPI00245352CC|nr:glycosyl hydrolase family 18 protein [Piscinibacter sp. XHJ-5]